MLQKNKSTSTHHILNGMKPVLIIILVSVYSFATAQNGFLGKKRGIDIDVADLVLYRNFRPTAQIAVSKYFGFTASIAYRQANMTDTIDYRPISPQLQFNMHETFFAVRGGVQFSLPLSDNYAPLGAIIKLEIEHFSLDRSADPLLQTSAQRADTSIHSNYLFSNRGFVFSTFWGISKNIGTSFYYCWGLDLGFRIAEITEPSNSEFNEYHFTKRDVKYSHPFYDWSNEESNGMYASFYIRPRVRIGFLF